MGKKIIRDTPGSRPLHVLDGGRGGGQAGGNRSPLWRAQAVHWATYGRKLVPTNAFVWSGKGWVCLELMPACFSGKEVPVKKWAWVCGLMGLGRAWTAVFAQFVPGKTLVLKYCECELEKHGVF